MAQHGGSKPGLRSRLEGPPLPGCQEGCGLPERWEPGSQVRPREAIGRAACSRADAVSGSAGLPGPLAPSTRTGSAHWTVPAASRCVTAVS